MRGLPCKWGSTPAAHLRGSSGFSEAWPHPGQTASCVYLLSNLKAGSRENGETAQQWMSTSGHLWLAADTRNCHGVVHRPGVLLAQGGRAGGTGMALPRSGSPPSVWPRKGKGRDPRHWGNRGAYLDDEGTGSGAPMTYLDDEVDVGVVVVVAPLAPPQSDPPCGCAPRLLPGRGRGHPDESHGSAGTRVHGGERGLSL